MRDATPAPAASPPASRLGRRSVGGLNSLVWAGRGDLAASVVLIVPLFLAYEIGVLFAGNVNGADVVTRSVYAALGRQTYLLVNAGIAIVFLLWVRRQDRWRALSLEAIAPVIIEAVIYAITLAAVVAFGLHRLLGLSLTPGAAVNALGAGVHEELVFRLGAMGGLVALLLRIGGDRRVVVAFALVAAAVAFAGAHHVGQYGEPFTKHAFAFRITAGIVFGLVFWFRSLAHAVYAHAFYDMLVYLRT